ncbi:MAG: ATP-binding protein [Caldilineaceae bacterium]
MSHELRTPLNTILGAAELLLEEVYGPLSRMQRTRLRNIEESGQHLLELINEVLDMAKIEAGKLQLETEPVDVENTCEASLRLIQQAAHKKGLRVDVEIADDVGVIEADGRRLKQMLVNLLSNAVKFTPSEGVIGLRAARDLGQGVVRFTVWDTGIGIAKDEQKRLFMPFVQVDSALTRQYDGTGLGLSLVHKMAQLHGGELSLESALGYGSEFTVTLPLSDESVEQATENSQTMPLEAPVLSVLLIGENQVDAQALNAYFADKAYTVHLAQNHEAAIRHVQETYYHLIIIDLHVTATHSIDVRKGNSDALKTVQAIRAESRCRFSPIVLLAEQQACPDQQESQRAGVTACLQKAPDMQQLFAALEELLHREILS